MSTNEKNTVEYSPEEQAVEARKLFNGAIAWHRKHGSLKADFDSIVITMAKCGISWADLLKVAQSHKDWPKNEKGKPMGRDAAVKASPDAESVSTFKRLNSYRSLYRVADVEGIPQLTEDGKTYKVVPKAPKAPNAPPKVEDLDNYEKELVQVFQQLDKELAGLPQAKQKTIVELIAKLKKMIL